MFPQQKRRKTLLDFNFKKIRNNDCENVKKSIPVDDLACSKNNPQNVIEQGSATFFAQRTGLSRKTFCGPALKININIQQLNFISAHKILQQ